MGVGEAMIVAGVGCRKGARGADIEAAVAAALAAAGPTARLIVARVAVGPATCALAEATS